MGYALFASRKIYYVNMINNLNNQLDNILQTKQSLMTLSANIADGKITIDEIASDPANLNNYLGFIQGSTAFKESDQGSGDTVGTISGFLTGKEYSPQEVAALSQLLDQSLGAEYAKQQQKRLLPEESQLDMQQKRIETKLAAAQQQLQAVEQAEGQAIQQSTPKFAGLG